MTKYRVLLKMCHYPLHKIGRIVLFNHNGQICRILLYEEKGHMLTAEKICLPASPVLILIPNLPFICQLRLQKQCSKPGAFVKSQKVNQGSSLARKMK